MPGSRNTLRPNRCTVMLFWAAISFTVGPGVAAWADATPSNVVAAAVHPAMAIAALRIAHRGRFKALSSRVIRRVTAHPNTGDALDEVAVAEKDQNLDG